MPTGFANLLRWCKSSYNDPPIYITENGFSDRGTLEDYGRIKYFNVCHSTAQVLNGTGWACSIRSFRFFIYDSYYFDGKLETEKRKKNNVEDFKFRTQIIVNIIMYTYVLNMITSDRFQ